MVIFALVLYAAFAFRPIVELPIFSRTLNLSPGDMVTILLVLGLFIKALLKRRKSVVIERPPAVVRFLFAYVFLAVVFLLPTLLFFVLHNELATSLPRSLFSYLLWIIALVLFYYGSDSQVKVNELRQLVWLLMAAFCAGVIGNLVLSTPNVNLLKLIIDTFTSQGMRLGGQIADPNQLGTLAAFFSVISIVGIINENRTGDQGIFFLFTVGTGFILLLTQSRESLLTIFIACLCLVVLLMRRKQYSKALIISLGMILSAIFVVTSVPRIVETLLALNLGDTGAALSSRDEVWRVTGEIVLRNPFGIGFENLYHLTNNTIEQAHNSFLQTAIIAGVVGFFTFASFWLLLFRLFWERMKSVPDNWILEAYLVFSVGYLVTSLGSDHFISFYTFNAIFFGLLGFASCAR